MQKSIEELQTQINNERAAWKKEIAKGKFWNIATPILTTAAGILIGRGSK